MIRTALSFLVGATLVCGCYLSHQPGEPDVTSDSIDPVDTGDPEDATDDPGESVVVDSEGERCVEVDPTDRDSGIFLYLYLTLPPVLHLFSPEHEVSLRLGSHSETSHLQCTNLIEGCSMGLLRTTVTPQEQWENYLMVGVEICDNCPEDCDVMGSAWTPYELMLNAGPLAGGSYEVLYDSSDLAASGFVVDRAAAAILEDWSRECGRSDLCEPTPSTVESLAEETTFDVDELIELPLLIEAPFRCPQEGVITEVAWSKTASSPIELVFYSMEPELGSCSCPETGCPPLRAQRTLTIVPSLLSPGTYPVEHDGELVETFHID